MKVKTTILETVAYFISFYTIYYFFYANSIGRPFFEVIAVCAVTGVIGYFINKWELRVEEKRTEVVKQEDYIFLTGFGILSLLIALSTCLDPDKITYPWFWGGIYLLLSAKKRRDKYNDSNDINVHHEP